MRLAKIIIVGILMSITCTGFADIFVENINCTDAVISYNLTTPAMKSVVVLPITQNHPTYRVKSIEIYPAMKNETESTIAKGAGIYLRANGFYLMSDDQYCAGTPFNAETFRLVKTLNDGCTCE